MLARNAARPVSMRSSARKHARERGVDPVDDGRRAAEVALQREAPQPHRADAALLREQEQRHVGVAKPIDRLHRIADEEQRAPVVGLPTRRQQLEQPALRLRGVLELVDEQVLDAPIEREQQLRRRVDLAERALRRECKLDEVDGAPLRERDLELGGEPHEHDSQRRETRHCASV